MTPREHRTAEPTYRAKRSRRRARHWTVLLWCAFTPLIMWCAVIVLWGISRGSWHPLFDLEVTGVLLVLPAFVSIGSWAIEWSFEWLREQWLWCGFVLICAIAIGELGDPRPIWPGVLGILLIAVALRALGRRVRTLRRPRIRG